MAPTITLKDPRMIPHKTQERQNRRHADIRACSFLLLNLAYHTVSGQGRSCGIPFAKHSLLGAKPETIEATWGQVIRSKELLRLGGESEYFGCSRQCLFLLKATQ